MLQIRTFKYLYALLLGNLLNYIPLTLHVKCQRQQNRQDIRDVYTEGTLMGWFLLVTHTHMPISAIVDAHG